MIDTMFLLAVGTLGWGISLATYSIFARRRDWPVGALHADVPAVPVLLGLGSVVIALMFAYWRGAEAGGWIIVSFGLLLAVFWTGFLRVGSQISLLLAPVTCIFLVLAWVNHATL